MSYTFKVWLFTILISPWLIALISTIFGLDSLFYAPGIIIIAIIVGFIFSMPTMIIFTLIKSIYEEKLSNRLLKMLLSAYSFLSVWVTFYVVDEGIITDWPNQTIIVMVYTVTMVTGVWYYRVEKQ